MVQAPFEGRDRRRTALTAGGAVAALLVSAGLFTRYGIGGHLSRDEAIYAYGGQRLVDGVAPYASIFDPKTPLATLLSGLGVALGRGVGAGDLEGIRVLFCVLSCLTVLAVYLLVVELWRSIPAAILAAVTFASFRGFAMDALAGPNAKTPGVLLAVVALLLVARGRWFWGAAAGSLASLAWQPLAVFAVIAVLGAALREEPGRRRRASAAAVAGAVLPLAAAMVYFTIAGALEQFVEAAVAFPLTGVERGSPTVERRASRIVAMVGGFYGNSRFVFWGGWAAFAGVLALWLARERPLAGALRHPLVSAVGLSAAAIVAYSLNDFQGYSDVFPLLPYAAIGVGGAVVILERLIGRPSARRALQGVALACAAALAVLSWTWFTDDRLTGRPPRDADRGLATQRAQSQRLADVVVPGTTLYVLGNPVPLVLTGRANPDRYIYLGSGVAKWRVHHEPGGLDGWRRRILAARPAVVVLAGWRGQRAKKMARWLEQRFVRRRVGTWTVFVRPRLEGRLQRAGPGAAG